MVTAHHLLLHNVYYFSGDVNIQSHKLAEGYTSVSNAAERVWGELYLTQKQLLEDRCKVAQSRVHCNQQTVQVALVPEMNAARALIGECCAAQWQSYVDTEIRGPARDLNQIHVQLQSVKQTFTEHECTHMHRNYKKSHHPCTVSPPARVQ